MTYECLIREDKCTFRTGTVAGEETVPAREVIRDHFFEWYPAFGLGPANDTDTRDIAFPDIAACSNGQQFT